MFSLGRFLFCSVAFAACIFPFCCRVVCEDEAFESDDCDRPRLKLGNFFNIRRAIEAEGIPYTYVSSNYFAGYFLPTLAQPGQFAPPPPKDKVFIYGDGNPKVIFIMRFVLSQRSLLPASPSQFY
ncbi:unnamed protein product [Trifolium pratense]|uniref:Uncharacterized protein n=1 Tax=Trifolium pratense TaxID=57577 RepID=A0ACB0MCN3_TRIPR|nr:unnamed protein product [Trifolium pratense]